MKTLALTLLAAVAAAIALSTDPDSLGAPRGSYVEARSATVFAGACHIQSELDTRGREAVLAWRFEGGAEGDVDLAGLALVVAVEGDANLGTDPEAARRSVVYLSADESDARREAALAWLGRAHADLVGEVVAQRRTDLTFELDAEGFRVAAGDAVLVDGSALPDRACCTMPFDVWYEPLAPVAAPLVGLADARVADPALARSWSLSETNCAFFGSFGETTSGSDLTASNGAGSGARAAPRTAGL